MNASAKFPRPAPAADLFVVVLRSRNAANLAVVVAPSGHLARVALLESRGLLAPSADEVESIEVVSCKPVSVGVVAEIEVAP